jgi:hypothetical protein
VRPAALLVAATALGAAVVAAPAAARAQDPPDGRMALVLGVQTGTGAVASDYGIGHLIGVEAAYQPMAEGQRLGFDVHWTVLFGGFEWPLGLGSDAASLTGGVETVHLQLGGRVRVPLRQRATIGYLGLGASLLRSNEPLPPDPARGYLGGYVGLGVQLEAAGLTLSTEVRRDMILDGPALLSFVIGVGFGV